MSSTTLKLTPKLRSRVRSVARKAGTTPHAFMVQAVEQVTAQAELRQAFLADAIEADREVRETGLAYDAEEVHAYLRAKVKGKKVARPKLRPWPG